MGEIRLVVMEVKVTNKFLLQAGTGSTLRGELPTGVMHERAKKVLGHCVRLGSSNPIPSRITYSGQYVRTLAAFIFKYRPIEILRANGITPPDPNRKRAIEETKPTELEDEEDKDISSIKQEIARLQAQLEEMEGQRPKKRAKVKREVKKEDTGVPFRSVGSTPGGNDIRPINAQVIEPSVKQYAALEVEIAALKAQLKFLEQKRNAMSYQWNILGS
ncbi:hypothetical protein AX16_005443 [Volvariella volvacea WC 439]|nr:hypothetical protein AX16_005443 [Volvariella volvacea WC 439]